jgi:hypothetical protein
MAIPAWQAGKLYQPGDLVVPASTPPALPSPPTNPGFESGDTGWSKGTDWVIDGSSGHAFEGTWIALCGHTADSELVNDNHVPVAAGQSITATCQAAVGSNDEGKMAACVAIFWYDSGGTFISRSDGNHVDRPDYRFGYATSSVTAAAPANAAFAAIGAVSFRLVSGDNHSVVDAFSWNYIYAPTVDATTYVATQSNAGFSGATEPAWPGLGNTVVDNEVTWEGVIASRVTWQATPILVSGATEPAFPTIAGATVFDNTIIWVASTGYVNEAPQSKYVAIAAKKVFAADGDIVRYCATVNPLDWTTSNDAGYLPTGLNTYGANPTKVLTLYRGNLVPLNSAGFQMWQVDPDPAAMAILDALPIGSTYHRAAQPVANDLLILTSLGVRNFGVAAASTNLAAGDTGQPIDTLVRAAVVAGTYTPGSIYYPGAGQYWLWFGPQVFVLTLDGKKKSWSRYVFPESITDATLVENDLYLRTATHKIWKVSDAALQDDVGGTAVDFTGVLWFPWMDLGNIATDKELVSIDLVGTGNVDVQVGWNEKDTTAFTASYVVNADTLDGTPIPMPLTGPSLSLKLTFSANQAWEWNASILNVLDRYMR